MKWLHAPLCSQLREQTILKADEIISPLISQWVSRTRVPRRQLIFWPVCRPVDIPSRPRLRSTNITETFPVFLFNPLNKQLDRKHRVYTIHWHHCNRCSSRTYRLPLTHKHWHRSKARHIKSSFKSLQIYSTIDILDLNVSSRVFVNSWRRDKPS